MLYIHEKPAHALSSDEVIKHLETNKTAGLSLHEAEKRLKKNGPNALNGTAHITPLQIFARQFKSAIVWILAFAAVISYYIGEDTEAYVISAIILITCFIGFFQEYKAENILKSIKKLTATHVRIMRSGEMVELSSEKAVVGDIIFLESGDKVPADARIMSSNRLSVDESSITGESIPSRKENCVLKEDAALADRKNMLFVGSYVSTGNAVAVITHTGMKTEMGKIAGSIPSECQITPLQASMNHFGKRLSVFVLLIGIFVIAFELIKGKALYDILLISIAIAVSGVPESLPIIILIGLSHGVYVMSKKNALVRKMDAVETLGCVTVICSDKTGTITRNEMTVVNIYSSGSFIDVSGRGYKPEGEFTSGGKRIVPKDNATLNQMIIAGLMCNNAKLSKKSGAWSCMGDTTEGSLIALAKKAGISEGLVDFEYTRIAEIPFDSARKCMSTIHQKSVDVQIFIKGAPDMLLRKCSRIEKNGAVSAMGRKEKESIMAAHELFSKKALRVLAIAYKPEKFKKKFDERDENNLIFLGLVGIEDPPREGVKESIAACRAAGINVVMITGDHASTAVAVAKKIGLINENGLVIEGAELDKMPDDEFQKVVERVCVYARATPEHKLKIIEAFEKCGHIVAMTGDGVNDAIALKKAHVGVSMGLKGTDVAKEASDISLLDDNFNTLVSAIKEGRTIYANLQRAMRFVLSVTTAEIGAIILAIILDFPLPLTAIMVLFINLVTDDLPAMGMSMDRAERNVMRERPRPVGEPMINKNALKSILLAGSLMTLATFGIFAIYHNYYGADTIRSQTAAFASLMVMEIMYAYAIRMPENARKWREMFKNRHLNATVVLASVAALSAIQIPGLQQIFSTTSLHVYEWLVVLLISAVVVVGIAKLNFPKKKLYEKDFSVIKNKVVFG
ncbi:MAG: cation-translocating P-type ATPase [Nanoarchaeota archaeon]|nr:cation-translocating P-type ATPase [Nanoarchaeota archaeon]